MYQVNVGIKKQKLAKRITFGGVTFVTQIFLVRVLR
jgi:hypothetical protein